MRVPCVWRSFRLLVKCGSVSVFLRGEGAYRKPRQRTHFQKAEARQEREEGPRATSRKAAPLGPRGLSGHSDGTAGREPRAAQHGRENLAWRRGRRGPGAGGGDFRGERKPRVGGRVTASPWPDLAVALQGQERCLCSSGA